MPAQQRCHRSVQPVAPPAVAPAAQPAPAAPNTVVNEILIARPCEWTLDTLDKQ